MSNPQQETKIELVTEAIEALVLATVTAAQSHDMRASAVNHENVVDARANVASALRELLTPTLRVMTNQKRPERVERVLYEGKGIDGMNLA